MTRDVENPASRVHRVGAVIVSYFPDTSALAQSIDALLPQIAHVVIVDNGSAPEHVRALAMLAEFGKVSLISFPENRGVAAAQNAGIAQIEAMGFEFVILFDQDSLAAPDMVHALLDAYDAHTDRGMRVAATAPLTVDARTGSIGKFATFSHGRIVQHACVDGSITMPVDLLISSGCLIPIATLQEIGVMNSGYFIDNVDTEWCIRARINGWHLLSVAKARLFHNLGDKTVRVWLGRWRNVSVHTPQRDYYICRNSLLMVRNLRMPFSWRVALISRLLMFIAFSLISLPPRQERAKKFWRGILHGFLNHAGKYQEDIR